MASAQLWQDWIQAQDAYSPDTEYKKAIGDALREFEKKFLSEDTTIWLLEYDAELRRISKGHVDYAQLASRCRDGPREAESFKFFFINRALYGDDGQAEPKNAHRLKISAEALRLLVTRHHIPPSFLFSLSRFYLPQGRDFRRFKDGSSKAAWHQWYFLPFRVQVTCTDRQRQHANSTAGSNQMDPFHYLHLPDEKVDIHGSHIAICIRHDASRNETAFLAFNFMAGRWSKVVEEPQDRILDALVHPETSMNPMFVHLVFLTTVIRWWNNALLSLGEQLIAYEKRLQEDIKDANAANNFYDDISKALHAIAAHIQRYKAELDSLEETGAEISRVFDITHGRDSTSITSIGYVNSQLKRTNALVKEQEKTTKNIRALLFNRMQISNDRLMVANAIAMHAIMEATRDEAHFSRDIALRSQKLAEEMKKDSVSMKIIAILTMFFLPGTFFAALLAMPFFATNPYLAGSGKIWIWFVLTVPATGAAFAFYRYWLDREAKAKASKDGMEDTDGKSTDIEWRPRMHARLRDKPNATRSTFEC